MLKIGSKEMIDELERKYEESCNSLEEIHLSEAIESAINRQPWLSPFLPCRSREIISFLELSEVTETDTVLDVGCGDGRVLVASSLSTRCRGIGIDISEDCIKYAKEMSSAEGVSHLISLYSMDASNLTSREILLLERATVVFLYIYPTLIEKIRSLVKYLLEKGARIVTLQYHFDGWEPSLRILDPNLHLYRL